MTRSRRTEKAITFAKSTVMLVALSLAAFWCLTSTLDDMTRIDCQAGVKAACEALK
jgi:hypothetical protein